MFEENFRVYGARKVWRQLRREGFTQDPGDDINGKRLELLNDVLPNLSSVGVL